MDESLSSDRSLATVLGPAWKSLNVPTGPRLDFRQDNTAIAPVSDDLQLVATLTRKTWDVWGASIRFFFSHPSDPATTRRELPDVVWAAPLPGNRIAVATRNAELQLLRLRHNDDLLAPPKVLTSHTLATLKADSVAAPTWATAKLKR